MSAAAKTPAAKRRRERRLKQKPHAICILLTDAQGFGVVKTLLVHVAPGERRTCTFMNDGLVLFPKTVHLSPGLLCTQAWLGRTPFLAREASRVFRFPPAPIAMYPGMVMTFEVQAAKGD